MKKTSNSKLQTSEKLKSPSFKALFDLQKWHVRKALSWERAARKTEKYKGPTPPKSICSPGEWPVIKRNHLARLRRFATQHRKFVEVIQPFLTDEPLICANKR